MSETAQIVISVCVYFLIVFLLVGAYKYFEVDFDPDMAPFFIAIFPLSIPMLLVILAFRLVFVLANKTVDYLRRHYG